MNETVLVTLEALQQNSFESIESRFVDWKTKNERTFYVVPEWMLLLLGHKLKVQLFASLTLERIFPRGQDVLWLAGIGYGN